MHAEFDTLPEVVKWLDQKIADYVKAGGKKWDFTINYHASYVNDDPTKIAVMFVTRG